VRRIPALLLWLAILTTGGCQAGSPTAAVSPFPGPTWTAAATPVPSAVRPTPTPAPTATATPSPTPAFSPVSSPLEGVTLADLTKIVSNPFVLPAPGHDDGHHGTDFAYYRWGERVGMAGLPVHAVFDGQVAGVTENRPPYGNMVIIETSWPAIPLAVRRLMASPLPPTAQPGDIRLTCPGFLTFPTGPSGQPSLYLLYAHMQATPLVHTGEQVTSGEQIGLVGTTGASVNPHLHLETRIGPPGATLPGMAHYIATASRDEMESYCTWRVSGTFAMLDPVSVLSAAQAN
jgi:murein DD-endopeptidase MepM/ murein hydrolase activator NlpD